MWSEAIMVKNLNAVARALASAPRIAANGIPNFVNVGPKIFELCVLDSYIEEGPLT